MAVASAGDWGRAGDSGREEVSLGGSTYSSESTLSAHAGGPGGHSSLADWNEKEMEVVVVVTHGEQPLMPLLSVRT